MQSQHNYGSFLSKSDLHVMIKNWQCLPKIAQRVRNPFSPWPCKWGGGGGGGVEQWPLSVGEVGFLLLIWKMLSSGNNSSLLNLVFLLTLTLFNNWLSLILPLRGKLVMGSDGHPGLYFLLRKLAPQCTMGLNFKKISHLRISGSFDGGRELKKKWPLAVLHGKSGNGHCPWKTMFESENFYFIEQREAIVRCLRSHGKYQHQVKFCIDRKENLSVPLNYTVLNKWAIKNAWRWRSWL